MTGAGGAGVGGVGREWVIPAGAGLAALETVALSTVLAFRGTRSAPFFIGCLAVKLPFCVLLMRRRAGAWFALLLWELTGLFAAVAAPGIPVVLRLLEFVLAGAVVALLAVSLPLFPRTELPDQ
ncbi:MAG TPA: hypothetical protein VGO92_09140 [Acidimicrobiales bacterium]|jgi:hypothetical protein|nr:hypothetical protein [Acidimicrobiales bacterium]